MTSKDPERRPWIAALAEVVASTYENWRNARTIRLGAGIAYYGLFALVPAVTLSVVIARTLVDQAALEDVVRDIGERLSVEDDAVAALIDELNRTSTQATLGLIGFASLLFAATIVFVAVEDAFDEIWELPVRSGVRANLRRRGVAVLVVSGGAILIVLTQVINTIAGLIDSLVPGTDSVLARLPDVFSMVSGWVVAIAMLVTTYQLLTREKLSTLALAIGSLATAVLLLIGTSLLGVYLNNVATPSIGGAAGTVFVVLLWLYYVAQIVLVGAHLIRVIDGRRA